MAKAKKSQRQLMDEAYLKSLAPELPMEQGPPAARTIQRFDTVPEECPQCLKRMTVRSGWALVFGDFLQCGGCGITIEVPRDEFVRFAKVLSDYSAALLAIGAPLPRKPKRERGAG